MIDDLITRLRAYRAHDATADALLDEAAAEIERLRAALLDLRDGAEQQSQSHVDVIAKIAAALEQQS